MQGRQLKSSSWWELNARIWCWPRAHFAQELQAPFKGLSRPTNWLQTEPLHVPWLAILGINWHRNNPLKGPQRIRCKESKHRRNWQDGDPDALRGWDHLGPERLPRCL